MKGIRVISHLRHVWAEINLDNLAFNMKNVKKLAENQEIIAVVKADAYGHGALDTVPTLLENGADRLAVAVLSEAMELRKGGIKCPIMILGFTPTELSDELLDYDIEPTVYSYEQAREFSNAAVRKNKCLKIQIALDTGMGRIGFLPNDNGAAEVCKISKLSNIEINGIFSHFSTADEENKEYSYCQLNRFNEFIEKLKALKVNIKMRHISNSATIMDLPQAHFEAVRPGIILYGCYPSDQVVKQNLLIKPVMTLKANIVHIKKLPPGEYISYGRKFRTERESVIATLPIGYADGYTRLLFNKAKVIVNGKFAPVVGRICMDQCMVDVTDIEGVKNGDEVILIGKSNELSFTADEIAELIGTINYEVLCMIGKRVPRVYIRDGKVVKIRNYV